MILFDSGVQIESGYCGDMTRTYPVSGKFNDLQATLYNIVEDAHTHAVSMSKPGVFYKDVHLSASKIIAQGLINMGLMIGDPEEIVAAGAHTLFFQHGLGHMMGLDVHDMENLGEENVGYDAKINKSTEFGLKSLRLGRQLQEGNVITIEPGLYIIPELIDKFQSEGKFENFINYYELNKYRSAGGIRIENDYVVREDGIEVLGSPDGTSVQEIEALMKQNK
jgi:Xaa-Pro aminopeptidase